MTDFEIQILSAPLGKTWLFYAGQAGYILKSKSGQIMAVDVYFSECGERIEGHMGFKRLLPKLLNPANNIYDYLVATHPHFDHFDVDAMPILLSNPQVELIASRDCQIEVAKMGTVKARVHYHMPGDAISVGDYRIDFVECDHGLLAPDAYGVVITVDDQKIYMTGDTCKRMDRVDTMNSYGPFDIVIGPINGAYGNMNEEDFAEYASALHSELIIPCHYGLFARHGGNPGVFLQHMRAKSDKQVFLMAFGERFELKKRMWGEEI